jgi:hypothetical protein
MDRNLTATRCLKAQNAQCGPEVHVTPSGLGIATSVHDGTVHHRTSPRAFHFSHDTITRRQR